MKRREIVTGFFLRKWFLTTFAGYTVASRRWAPGLFGGHSVCWRLVPARDFHALRKPAVDSAGAKEKRSKVSSAIRAHGRRLL